MIKRLMQRLTNPYSKSNETTREEVVRCALKPRDGKYDYEPSNLEELDKYEKATKAAATVNDTVAFVGRLHQELTSLDGHDRDLNPAEGKVGVKGLQFEGSTVDATLLGDKNYELEARLEGNEQNPGYIKDRVTYVAAARNQDLVFHSGELNYRAREGYDTSTLFVEVTSSED